MSRPLYPVTDRALEAIERGLARKRWTDADLARELGTTRQAIGQIRSKKTQRSELLADILRAVDEPTYLALGLSDLDIELLELGKQIATLAPQDARALVDELKRRTEGELARAVLSRSRPIR